MIIRILHIVFFAFLATLCFSQNEVIELINPSFEGSPHGGGVGASTINGWQDCGVIYFEGETPPDIHLGMSRDTSYDDIYFGVKQPAADGFTFLGFVVRDNETYESVSQRLSKPLVEGKCYTFSIDLSRSITYISPYPQTGGSKSYKKPVVLRIYGGSAYCGKRELLAESSPVSNTEWETYDFEFTPTANHRYISISSYYKVPILVPYNGNLLVDNASNIVRVPCPGEEIVAEVEIPKETETEPEVVVKADPVIEEPVIEKPIVKVEATINKDLNRKTIKEGQVINLKKIYFDANAVKVNTKSTPALEELTSFLKSNKDVRIEIGGHTNDRPTHQFCDSLSTERAKSVAQFLLDNSIPMSQIEYKGYGKRYPISSNKYAEGRKRNQRVDIKVLQIGQ